MTTKFMLFSLVVCLFALRAPARLPEVPVAAIFHVSNTAPFEKETFVITLTIMARDVEIRQQLELLNLPDPNRITIFTPFETLPVQREADGHRTVEIRRYRAHARALSPGPAIIESTLRLTAQRRVRAFFGSMIEEYPLTIAAPAVALHVKPLPPSPENFSGAVGTFNVDIRIEPDELTAGDLVTVSTRISGEGWMENLRIPEIPDLPGLKTYPVSEVQSETQLRRFSQTVIPESTEVTAIPPLAITVFDTKKGDYVSHAFGPFPLRYRKERLHTLERFRPAGDDDVPVATKKRPANGRRITVFFRREKGESARTTEPVYAALAPSAGSLSTFRLPAGAPILILHRHTTWLLIDAGNRRGWIPESAIQPGD